MKSFIAIPILSLCIGTLNLATAQAPNWKIDQSHTSVNFKIDHFFSAVPGQFEKFDGEFRFDANNLNESGFAFTIEIASVNTDNQKRDNDLQSKNFFNAKKWPEIRFTSTKIKKESNGNYLAYGKLTIRDVTKDVKIPFTITGEMEHPMMRGTMILGLEFNYSLDRTDYGVGTGDWAATAVVGDEVEISIPMELNRKKG